jgi:hypothetical protein
MLAIGNEEANKVWEYNIPPGREKAKPSDSRYDFTEFLKLNKLKLHR